MRRSAFHADAAAGGGVLRRLAVLVAAAGVYAASCATTGLHTATDDAAEVASTASEDAPAAVPVAAPPPAPEDEWLRVRGITVEEFESTHRVVFDLSRTPDSVKDFRLPNPPRVVLDVKGPHKAGGAVDRYVAEDSYIERVRVGHYDRRMRLVIDLSPTAPADYTVRTEGAALVLYLGKWDESMTDRFSSVPQRPADAVGAGPAVPAAVSWTDPELTGGEGSAEGAGQGDVAAEDSDTGFAEADLGDAVLPLPDVPLGDAPAPDPTESPSSETGPAAAVPTADGADDPAVDTTAGLADDSAAADTEPVWQRAASARRETPEEEPVDAVAIDDEPEESVDPWVAEEELPRTSGRLAKLTSPAAEPKYTGKRISLDFKDADIQNVLRVIADVSGLNIIATDDVTGGVTLHLVDVPWDQALDVVLRSNRLKMVREGNVLRISTVERVREEQEELRAQQTAEKELEPLQVRYVRVNYARADKALLEKVTGVLTDRGSASFDERTNTVIVRDIRRGIDDAVQLIGNIDIQSPQVLIESNIVEGSTDFAQALGVQWGYRHLAGPATGNPTGMDFPGTVDFSGGGLGVGKPAVPASGGTTQPLVPLISDFPVPSNFGPGFGPGSGSAIDLALGSISGQDTLSARITALEDEGKGRIISRPRVITMNNIPARIESLTILRVRLPSTGTVVNTGAGGVAGSASAATEKIETGIVLIVTPQVSSDGFVLLNIDVKSSQADFSRTVDEIPTEVSRQATSNVLIQDGETVVLGGIFRNESNDAETGIPYLRRVPVLGWLFKRSLKRDRKEELLVFITPQVVAGYGAELPTASELWENRDVLSGRSGLATSYQ
jgi:type IV pilus assembly protein PilQ